MRGQPYLTQIKDKSGKLKSPYHHVEWYDPATGRNKRRSTGCLIGAQDSAANTFLAQFTLEREKPLVKDSSEFRIAVALRDYYEEHGQYTATAKSFRCHEARLNKGFPGLFIGQLTKVTVEKYVRECQTRGESNGTIRRDLEMLQAAINHTIGEGRITHAPKIKKPAPPAPRDRYLTPEEAEKLLAECKEDHLRSFCVLMLNTGQRPGAIEKLKWFQVDFAEGEIRFDKAAKHKNKQARPVAMNDTVRQLLTDLFAKKQTEYVLERYFAKKKTSKPAGCVKKSFAAACQRAGLEKVSRYTIRHTVLDRLNDVADEKTASDIGGHSQSRTTRHNYIKSKKEKQVTALNNLWTSNYAETTQNQISPVVISTVTY